MKQLLFPFAVRGHGRRLSFFLAAEEWVAMAMPGDEWFFSWVVEPTVICGRNQDIAREVDLGYCREHGIDVVRRRSGGGCVYADGGNIMTSYVCSVGPRTYEEIFREYTERIATQLRNMGFDATAGGRNDVFVAGRKISGGAFYRLGDKAISHSTMLYDTDPANMSRAITPARAKLSAKGVSSVASRIITAREQNPTMSFDDFHFGLLNGLCDGSYTVTDSRLHEIEEIERRYHEASWLQIDEGSDGLTGKTRHIAGLGTLTASVATDAGGIIKSLSISGDLLDATDLEALSRELIGQPATEYAVTQILNNKLNKQCGEDAIRAIARLIAEAAQENQE